MFLLAAADYHIAARRVNDCVMLTDQRGEKGSERLAASDGENGCWTTHW